VCVCVCVCVCGKGWKKRHKQNEGWSHAAGRQPRHATSPCDDANTFDRYKDGNRNSTAVRRGTRLSNPLLAAGKGKTGEKGVVERWVRREVMNSNSKREPWGRGELSEGRPE